MQLVLRSNYGDDSIALIEAIREKALLHQTYTKIWVVYIDTGWAASTWEARVQQGENFARSCGFEVVRLQSKSSFSELVLDRKQFPTPKFQWCAGFLKGLPFLEWLDEYDPHAQWRIALPKRQALYRKPIPAIKKECEYHGERDIWHPILEASNAQRDHWVKQAGFSVLNTRSLECEPCINSSALELTQMSLEDQQKLQRLEGTVHACMFPHKKNSPNTTTSPMDAFSMGCGDPFGCGL